MSNKQFSRKIGAKMRKCFIAHAQMTRDYIALHVRMADTGMSEFSVRIFPVSSHWLSGMAMKVSFLIGQPRVNVYYSYSRHPQQQNVCSHFSRTLSRLSKNPL